MPIHCAQKSAQFWLWEFIGHVLTFHRIVTSHYSLDQINMSDSGSSCMSFSSRRQSKKDCSVGASSQAVLRRTRCAMAHQPTAHQDRRRVRRQQPCACVLDGLSAVCKIRIYGTKVQVICTLVELCVASRPTATNSRSCHRTSIKGQSACQRQSN